MAMDGPQPADDDAAFHGSAPGHGGSRMLQADTWFQAAWRWTLEGGHAGDLLVQIRDIHSYLHRRCNVALWLASTTIAQRSAITGCRRKRVAECERVIGSTGVYGGGLPSGQIGQARDRATGQAHRRRRTRR